MYPIRHKMKNKQIPTISNCFNSLNYNELPFILLKTLYKISSHRRRPSGGCYRYSFTI